VTAAPSPAGTSRWYGFLRRRKYELLVAALLQHLFIAVVLPSLDLYTRVIWPLNMVVLGLFSVGIFAGGSALSRSLKHVTSVVVVLFPLFPAFLAPTAGLMVALSLSYVAFFLVILVEVMRYLLRPSYINIDLVSAAICGFLLLLEIGIFLMQGLTYALPNAFHGLDRTSFTTVYLDLVYFCCIVITSIGFGDITPTHHITKLATSMLGITGQMYSVVLVSILVGKYTSASSSPAGREREPD
jgi:hypothetical protein